MAARAALTWLPMFVMVRHGTVGEDRIRESQRLLERYTHIQTESEEATKKQFRAFRMATGGMHMFNMAVLGVNMSMLGLIFNIGSMTALTQEQREEFRRILGPMMLVWSTTNMLISVYMAFRLASEGLVKAGFILMGALAALGLALGALSAQGREIKVVVAAITFVIAGLAIAFWKAAFAAGAFWGIVTLGIAVAAIAIGAYAAVSAVTAAQEQAARAIIGLQRGGIVTRPTVAFIAERGPEAVIPLERVMRRLPPAEERPVTINIERMEVRAEDPREFEINLIRTFQRYRLRGLGRGE